MDSHPSTARRPHKSPAHTVKDQLLAALSSEPPQYISSRVSRPFYIPSCFRQHPESLFFVSGSCRAKGCSGGVANIRECLPIWQAVSANFFLACRTMLFALHATACSLRPE